MDPQLLCGPFLPKNAPKKRSVHRTVHAFRPEVRVLGVDYEVMCIIVEPEARDTDTKLWRLLYQMMLEKNELYIQIGVYIVYSIRTLW